MLSAALILLSATAVSAEDEPNVLVLTSDNFDSTIADNEFVLAEFYAPWCGHCKKLAPEYSTAADTLAAEGSPIKLGKVDATQEQALGSKFGVRGYPTLKFFRNGKDTEYNGPRDAAGIVNWLKKKTGPASTQLDSADAVAEFVAEKARVIVGSFKERSGAAYDAFLEVAKDGDMDDFVFADFVGGDDSVSLYTQFADVAKTTTDGLKEFALSKGYPLVDELPDAYARYQKKGLPLAIVFIDPEADNSALLEAATKAAEEVQGKLSISYANGIRFKSQLERMGLPTETLPALAAMKLSGKANYPFEGELTADAITAWANGIVDGSVKPTLKSEDVPAEQGAVEKVVGKSFSTYFEATKNGEKDVLLEVMAPWCGHCKSLAPKWEELGEKYSSNGKIVIGQMDGTQNDVEELEVAGFPSIFWISNGQIEKYSGGREVADFVSFIEKKSKFATAGDETESKTEL